MSGILGKVTSCYMLGLSCQFFSLLPRLVCLGANIVQQKNGKTYLTVASLSEIKPICEDVASSAYAIPLYEYLVYILLD